MTYIQRLRRRISRLSNANCMFDRNTTIPQAYANLLNVIISAKLRETVKEKLFNQLFAIKCNCSPELYMQLVKVEEDVIK